MSDTEHTKVEDRDKKRALPNDDSDDHDSDSEDRRYKRAAVNDSNSSSPQRPQHRRRTSEDNCTFVRKISMMELFCNRIWILRY